MTSETELFDLARALGEAIRAKDWTRAREQWKTLTTLYPPLTESQPHLAKVLRNQEALVYPRSKSIH